MQYYHQHEARPSNPESPKHAERDSDFDCNYAPCQGSTEEPRLKAAAAPTCTCRAHSGSISAAPDYRVKHPQEGDNTMPHTDDSSPTVEARLRQIDPTARMQVYFQGILDDACFLYAQANAYKALTGKRVTREHWNRAVSRLPQPAAFLGGPGATQLSYDQAVRHIEGILDAFSDPGETFRLDQLNSADGIADLCGAVSADSVVVFAYGGHAEFQNPQTHVVCGVAVSDGPPVALHLACSAAFSSRYLRFGQYFERHHPHLGRWSNDSIQVGSDVVIAPNFRWRVTFAEPPS